MSFASLICIFHNVLKTKITHFLLNLGPYELRDLNAAYLHIYVKVLESIEIIIQNSFLLTLILVAHEIQ